MGIIIKDGIQYGRTNPSGLDDTDHVVWASWDGDKWYVLWYDTDLIFVASSNLTATPTLDLIAATKTGQFTYKYNPIFDKLLQTYYDELFEAYAKLRSTIFTDSATIIKYFTDFRDKWGSDNVALERAKWGQRHPELDINLCGDLSRKDWHTVILNMGIALTNKKAL